MKKSDRKNPTHTFQCENKLWKRLQRIAVDRGRELSLEPKKLMSSLVRSAIEQYIVWYEDRAARQAAFDQDFERANNTSKPTEPERK